MMNSTTGIFSLSNDAAIRTSYEVEIDIITTDGFNDMLYTVTGVVIDTVCGPESTKLMAQDLDFVTKAPNTLPTLSLSSRFINSNPSCAVNNFTIE